MVSRVCDECGTSYEAKQKNSRFCRDACRKKASRSKTAGKPAAPMSGGIADMSADDGLADDKLITATEQALVDAGQLDTWQGQGALVLARDLARSRYGAGAHAALMKELRAVMAEIAPAKPKAEGSRLDGVRGKGATRRTNPAGLRIVS